MSAEKQRLILSLFEKGRFKGAIEALRDYPKEGERAKIGESRIGHAHFIAPLDFAFRFLRYRLASRSDPAFYPSTR